MSKPRPATSIGMLITKIRHVLTLDDGTGESTHTYRAAYDIIRNDLDLIEAISRDMDARTGRQDPSTRAKSAKRKTAKRAKSAAKRKPAAKK